MHLKTELFLLKETAKDIVDLAGGPVGFAVWPGTMFVLLGISAFQQLSHNNAASPAPTAISAPAPQRPQTARPAVAGRLPGDQPKQ